MIVFSDLHINQLLNSVKMIDPRENWELYRLAMSFDVSKRVSPYKYDLPQRTICYLLKESNPLTDAMVVYYYKKRV